MNSKKLLIQHFCNAEFLLRYIYCISYNIIIKGIRETVRYGKSLISVFQDFFTSINKICILRGGLGLGSYCIRF